MGTARTAISSFNSEGKPIAEAPEPRINDWPNKWNGNGGGSFTPRNILAIRNEVKEILGHADIKTTMMYAHLEQKGVSSRARDVINKTNTQIEKPELKVV